MPWALCPWGRSSRYPLDRRLGPRAGMNIVTMRRIPFCAATTIKLNYMFSKIPMPNLYVKMMKGILNLPYLT
jgi:hypothetical protein